MRKLGMIGGTSWHSTIEYYRYINQAVNDRVGDVHVNPHLILYSLDIGVMKSGDWDRINETYRQISKTLEVAGAEGIIICANTPHKVVPHIQPGLQIPVLHIADAIGAEADRLGLSRLALFGTKPVMEQDFIKGWLAKNWDKEVLTPHDEHQPEVHRLIAQELTAGSFRADTKDWFLQRMTEFKRDGADGIILGCTELPLLISQEDFDLPLLDTTSLHAQYAVDFIFGDRDLPAQK